ncbi:solute carrier organic anion transporter family member 4A1-like isoform X2 [Ornithodoros turicata]|uniref:solute carrier organic anion transporter family member 4A1-like isoform X2 n=1 Tax=Ornithodoros turicata TaxID=34597 RepID=UPI003138BB6D
MAEAANILKTNQEGESSDVPGSDKQDVASSLIPTSSHQHPHIDLSVPVSHSEPIIRDNSAEAVVAASKASPGARSPRRWSDGSRHLPTLSPGSTSPPVPRTRTTSEPSHPTSDTDVPLRSPRAARHTPQRTPDLNVATGPSSVPVSAPPPRQLDAVELLNNAVDDSKQQQHAHSSKTPTPQRQRQLDHNVDQGLPNDLVTAQEAESPKLPADVVPTVSALVPLVPTDVASPAPFSPEFALVYDDEAKQREQDTQCGCCGYPTPSLRKFRTMSWVVFILCMSSFTRSFSASGIMLVVLPTLERRYSLSGSESGSIVSSNDLAASLIMLPVSFLASNRHKPRILGCGIILMGIGNFIVTLAHFLAPAYHVTGQSQELCPRVKSGDGGCTGDSVRNFRFVMIAGQFIAGIGSTPINTVSIAYLDENLPMAKSAAYVGIFNSMSVFGPAIGFICGGLMLKRFVDISTDVKALNLTPDSGAWVGAWWIGFIITAILGIIFGSVTNLFPKHLPEFYTIKAERKLQQMQDINYVTMSGIQSGDFGERLSDLPMALKQLCKNCVLIFLCFAFSFGQLYCVGITAVVAKFFQAQFSMSPTGAALIIGPVVLVSGMGGAIMGGILVSRFKMDSPGIIRMCFLNCLIAIVSVMVYRTYCKDSDMAINSSFDAESGVGSEYDLPCNSHCHCSEHDFDPVCSADNKMYVSACYAGCQTTFPAGKNQGCQAEGEVFGIRRQGYRKQSHSILDSSCQAWNFRCGEKGNCLSYTNRDMAHGMFITLTVCMAASAICYAVAFGFLIRSRRQRRQKVQSDQPETVVEEAERLEAADHLDDQEGSPAE